MGEGINRESGKVLFVTSDVWEKMIFHCQHEEPLEACGLLSGRNGTAETIWMMENIERSPTSFAMDIEHQRNVFRQIEEKGEQLLAIYHSHPTAPALPSARDIEFATYPDAAYIIVSLAAAMPETRMYRIIEGQVSLLSFHIT